MSQETLQYTIPADANGDPDIQVDAVLTLSDTQNTDGSYLVTNITGTRTVGSTQETITGVVNGGVDGGDERFWIDPTQNLTTGSYVDGNGLTYSATGSPNAAGGNSPDDVNFAYNMTYNTYSEDGANTSAASSVSASQVACFVTGSRIRTSTGDIRVEALRIGDTVVTGSGALRPIKWIGNRSYAGRFANSNPDALPICFKAGSLEDGVPARDLWVSPKHAMVLDGLLVPAEFLVNGVTIVKAKRVETVTYWHVELDSHDVLIAEGALAESFIDDSSRGMFRNAHTFAELYPDAGTPEAVYCLPRVEHGYALEQIRTDLSRRAGLGVNRSCGALEGCFSVAGGVVQGWARNALYPNASVCLDIVVDGVVTQILANREGAADVGPHTFMAPLPAGCRSVSVRRSVDGVVLESAGLDTIAA